MFTNTLEIHKHLCSTNATVQCGNAKTKRFLWGDQQNKQWMSKNQQVIRTYPGLIHQNIQPSILVIMSTKHTETTILWQLVIDTTIHNKVQYMNSEQTNALVQNPETTYLSLLVSTQFKVLASFNGNHPLWSAVWLYALKPQHNLLCSLGLLLQQWPANKMSAAMS